VALSQRVPGALSFSGSMSQERIEAWENGPLDHNSEEHPLRVRIREFFEIPETLVSSKLKQITAIA
jgi:hypothetical protein